MKSLKEEIRSIDHDILELQSNLGVAIKNAL